VIWAYIYLVLGPQSNCFLLFLWATHVGNDLCSREIHQLLFIPSHSGQRCSAPVLQPSALGEETALVLLPLGEPQSTLGSGSPPLHSVPHSWLPCL
jgi:hypothetical protein